MQYRSGTRIVSGRMCRNPKPLNTSMIQNCVMNQLITGDGHPSNIWEEYPYLLPMLPTVLASLVSIFLFIFAFPETLPSQSTSPADQESEPFVPPSDGEEAMPIEEEDDRTAPFRCCRSCCEAHPGLPSACTILAIPDVMLCIGNYGCTLFIAVCYNDVIGLWAAATPDVGGLGWTTDTTGTYLAVVGVCSAIWTFFVYPVSLAKWKLRSQLRFGQLALIPTLICLPFVSSFQRREGGFGDWKLWVPLLLLGVSVQLWLAICFTSVNVMANNSVRASQRVRYHALKCTCLV